MATAEKQAAVAEIADRFRDPSAAVLTEYRGLTVAQLKQLRRSLARARHLCGREEHPDQDRRQEAGVHSFDELLTARRRWRSSPETRSRPRRVSGPSPRPTRRW